MKNMKLRKNDQVIVTIGKDKGKKGKVEAVFPKENMVVITGVNIFKKHTKPQGEGKAGGIVEINKPLKVSKIALVCPKCAKATRIGYKIDVKSKLKIRVCRKCKGVI